MITKEAIEAAALSDAAFDGRRFDGLSAADKRRYRERSAAALTAAFAAMPGPAVKVRGLVWEVEDNGWWGAKAVAFPGGYEVRKTDRGHVRVRGINGSWESFDGTLDEAKAAAQADYEARILSTLTPAPDLASENERLPQDVINLVIAAREFWDVAMDESDESAALDSALEAFSSRVPYENEPEEDRAALERT